MLRHCDTCTCEDSIGPLFGSLIGGHEAPLGLANWHAMTGQSRQMEAVARAQWGAPRIDWGRLHSEQQAEAKWHGVPKWKRRILEAVKSSDDRHKARWAG